MLLNTLNIDILINICLYISTKLLDPVLKRRYGMPFGHKTVKEKIKELGQSEWGKRYSFAVVRIPWDKVVSITITRVHAIKPRATGMSPDLAVHQI